MTKLKNVLIRWRFLSLGAALGAAFSLAIQVSAGMSPHIWFLAWTIASSSLAVLGTVLAIRDRHQP